MHPQMPEKEGMMPLSSDFLKRREKLKKVTISPLVLESTVPSAHPQPSECSLRGEPHLLAGQCQMKLDPRGSYTRKRGK